MVRSVANGNIQLKRNDGLQVVRRNVVDGDNNRVQGDMENQCRGF